MLNEADWWGNIEFVRCVGPSLEPWTDTFFHSGRPNQTMQWLDPGSAWRPRTGFFRAGDQRFRRGRMARRPGRTGGGEHGLLVKFADFVMFRHRDRKKIGLGWH